MNTEHQHVDDDGVVFNGLDGATGKYLLQATAEQISAIAMDEELDPGHINDVKERVQVGEEDYGVVDAVEDVKDLAQTGWGVIFADDEDPAVIDALRELLDYRQQEAAKNDPRFFRTYSGADGYHRGETKRDFLRRRGAPPSGAVDPQDMPYYLLIVGGPEKIPYSFQYQLDVQYAVGRIHFETPEEYAQYARSVVTAERKNPRPRRAVFFGVKNEDDPATNLSATALVKPLFEKISAWQPSREAHERWDVHLAPPDETKKAQLKSFIGGAETPALLFTASHGIGFPNGDPRQRLHQGALICRDWPGPEEWGGAILPEFYLSADDVPDDAQLLGLLAFHFACFGAGTPRLDDYPQRTREARKLMDELGLLRSAPIAHGAFVAHLPQRLLGHPKGGALAVIGHVERALGSSFAWAWSGRRRTSVEQFNSVVRRLIRGYPIGAAVEYFNERYAELGVELSDEIREIKQFGKVAEPDTLARLWTGNADARGYMIVGDPAVRLIMPERAPKEGTRETIEPIRLAARAGATSDATTPATSGITAPSATADVSTMPAAADATMAPTSTGATSQSGGPPDAAQSTRTTTAIAPGGRPGSSRTGTPTIRLEIDGATGRISITTTGVSQPSPGATASPEEEYAFPLFGASGPSPIEELRNALSTSLQNFAHGMGKALADVVADVSVLEVATFVSGDIDNVEYNANYHRFEGDVRRRAMTCIKVDGDTLVLVPEEASAVDQELWAIHADMVERAQAARAELIKAAADAASGLLGALPQL